MAFKKLREIRDRFEKHWINGGFIFSCENEINEKHNNDYPLLVVLPPTSELPATEEQVKKITPLSVNCKALLSKPNRFA